MMNKQIFTATLLALSTSLVGCGDLGFDFDFTHDSPEYLIVGERENAKGDDPTAESDRLSFAELEFAGGWTSFTFDSGVGDIDERITGLQVLDAAVYGTAGESDVDADLSFVQRMEIYVVGEDGLPSFLLASYERNGELRNPAILPLYIHEEINLLEYMQEGLEFYTFLQGEHPERNVTFQTSLDFRGFSRGY